MLATDTREREEFLASLDEEQRDALARLPVEQREAMILLALQARPSAHASAILRHNQPATIDVVDFLESCYFVPETRLPMVLEEHQKQILRYALDPRNDFQTIVYSTIKKSGKTAIAAGVARWVAETWGYGNEVYMVANDAEQARGRQYASFLRSIELTPGYLTQKRLLPGKWHIVEREARHLPTSSSIKALSGDYRGEAGSNPTATFWSELWGFTSEGSQRLYEELTPVATRARSLRFVETYAGFEDESKLLYDLYRLGVRDGVRATRDQFPHWPFDEEYDPALPIWINKDARLFMYWDTWREGQRYGARRMPWQRTDEADVYYATQERTLRPEVFRRLHRNEWVSQISALLPIEWYDACRGELPPWEPTREPMVLGVDGAVTSDCAAITGVTRHPERRRTDVVERLSRIWTPPRGGAIDLNDVEAEIRRICSAYNVVCITFDAYQLHQMMQNLTKDGVAWCLPFSQGATREIADKQLYDIIRGRRFTHANGERSEQREHMRNAASQTSLREDTKLRIVKKAADLKIDATVALSMAVYQCLRLLLD